MSKIYQRKTKHGSHWVADYTLNGRRCRHKIPAQNKTQALDILKTILGDIARDEYRLKSRDQTYTFGRLCDEFLKYSRTNKKSWKSDEQIVQRLKEHFRPSTPLLRITSFQVEKFKSERAKSPPRHPARKAKTVSNGTVNRSLACLKTMFNVGMKLGLCTSNPVVGVKFLPEPLKQFYVVSADEELQLLETADRLPEFPYLRTVIVIALHTGLRRGEIVRMKWENVDFEKKLITLPETKAGDLQHVPMNALVHNTLLEWQAGGIEGEEIIPVNEIKRSWAKVRKEAGLPDRCRFHDLRHTYGSRLAHRGVHPMALRRLMRHKDSKMTERYVHFYETHLHDAVELLVEQPAQSGADMEHIPFVAAGGGGK